MSRTRVKSAACLTLAPALCALLFWRVLKVWFLTDDFAWLGLPQLVHSNGLATVLFHPYAQGTVRVLSERVYFLIFSSLFGLNAVPFRICALLTWFADLTLAAAIGSRLTGSRAAGVLAALLWTSSVSIVRGLAWASAYDQILCALCMLAALYLRLRWLENGSRKWIWAEWAAYVAGFGALESIVMYPAIALLHGWCTGRRRLANVATLAAPAVAFTAFHLFYLPRDPNYPIAFDHRIPSTLLHYFGWAVGPRQLGLFPGVFQGPGVVVVGLIAAILGIFILRCALRRQYVPLFFAGWFLLALAPVLVLPNNIQDYYLTIPVLGLAWLAGWGLVEAWRNGWISRVAAIALLAVYLNGSIRQIDDSLRWFQDRTGRLRDVVLGLREQVREHPDGAFVLSGVDADLYQSGFEDDPFRLFGLRRIYLVRPSGDFAIAARFQPPGDLGAAYHLGVTARGVGVETQESFLVNVSDPSQARALGAGWYAPESGHRWMAKSATIKLVNPRSPNPKLFANGFAPEQALAKGPVTVRFRSGAFEVGSSELRQPGEFALAFPLPPELAGQSPIEVTVEVDRTFHAPGDARELGLTFKFFEIR